MKSWRPPIVTPKSTYKPVIAVVTQHETRVWAHGADLNSHPEIVLPPDPERRHPHVRTGEDDHMHHRDSAEAPYFESIAHAVSGAGYLILVGHGKGNGSEMERFHAFLERKYPRLAETVIGALRVNLPAMTEGEVVSMAREWFDQQVRLGEIRG